MNVVEPKEYPMSDCGCKPATDMACTLGPAEFRQRLAYIRELTGRALRSRERDGLQLRLAYEADAAAEVRELVGMERQCCSFLDFKTETRGDRFLVTITAPEGARDSIEEIFAEFAGTH